MKRTLSILTAFIFLAVFSNVSYGEEKKKDITMDEAIAIAVKEIPGDVVKTELEKGYYEIKIKTKEGRTEKIYVDAKDGSILKKEKKSYEKDRDDKK
ncbi:MAG: PepSY domain-containing protein [Deltaproteobacteria bacterium]|nr:PepSY domain-containing protein [Deltaproteobacteria bacterium]